MTDRAFNVLFLCTGNSARSILADSLLNHLGKDRFKAYSAGSIPKGTVNPWAIKLLRQHELPTEGLRSKNWKEFAIPDAPRMDFVFTVCDQAASEPCPIWPGQPMTAHWGVPDPAAVEGSDLEIMNAFRAAYSTLEKRIQLFLALPIASLNRLALTKEIQAIGTAGADGGKP